MSHVREDGIISNPWYLIHHTSVQGSVKGSNLLKRVFSPNHHLGHPHILAWPDHKAQTRMFQAPGWSCCETWITPAFWVPFRIKCWSEMYLCISIYPRSMNPIQPLETVQLLSPAAAYLSFSVTPSGPARSAASIKAWPSPNSEA